MDLEIPSNTSVIVYAIGDLGGDFTVVTQSIELGQPDGYGIATVVHGVPGLTVDVYMNGNLAIAGFAPETITDQFLVPAGTYDIAIYETGADPLVDLAEGANTVVYAVGTLGSDFTLLVDVVVGLGEGGAFDDIASSSHKTNITTMARVGITKGTSATTFSPEVEVTRGQMAAFIRRSLSLPGSAVDAFTDDDGSLFEGDINAIAALGITKATTYNADLVVTRRQMAAFMNRAFNLPDGGATPFTDVPGTLFEDDIAAIYAAGITVGTSATTFSPDVPVTRDQMATFLARALGIGS